MDDSIIWDIQRCILKLKREIDNKTYENSIVYHYTDYGGLVGILWDRLNNSESQIYDKPLFFFSRYDTLNDTSEGNDILEVYAKCLESLYEKGSVSKAFYDEIKNVTADNTFLFFKPNQDSNSSNGNEVTSSSTVSTSSGKAYICSFSEDKDSLPMWNYYCKSGMYNGYNIGIKNDAMISTSVAYRNGYSFFLFKVTYDEDEKMEYITKLIYELYEIYERSEQDEESIHWIRQNMIAFINTYRFAFKKHYFEHEREYRAVIILPDDDHETLNKYPVLYRNVNDTIVPYIKYIWEECHPFIVNIAPSNISKDEKDSKRHNLLEMLHSRGWNEIKDAVFSDIPIRY